MTVETGSACFSRLDLLILIDLMDIVFFLEIS